MLTSFWDVTADNLALEFTTAARGEWCVEGREVSGVCWTREVSGVCWTREVSGVCWTREASGVCWTRGEWSV